ncbi:MAG: iron ABC transporter permease [Deltaproteobacteria bacterium]|nr:iron ABC transporter permease [Deltaproteobacteria bacterium]
MRNSYRFFAMLALAPVAAFLVYPAGVLFAHGWGEGLRENLLTEERFWRIVLFTYSQAFLSTALAGCVGGVMAVAFTEWGLKGKGLLWRAGLLCYSLPSILVASAVVMTWGSRGPLAVFGIESGAEGWSGILLAHTFLNFGLFLKNLSLALRENGREEEIGALSLGLTRWQTFRVVTLPKVLPTFLSTALTVFLLCSSSFLIVLLLGGGPRFTSLEVAVFQAVRVNFQLGVAAQIAAFQVTVGTLLFLLIRRPRVMSSQSVWVELYSPRVGRPIWIGLLWGLFLWVAAWPLLGLLRAGWVGGSIQAWHGVWGPWLISVDLAVRTSLFCGVVALPLAMAAIHLGGPWGLAIEIAASLPVILSTTLISLSWMLAFRDQFFAWRGNLTLIAGIQAIGALPIVFRVISDGLGRISPSLYRSAQSIGVSAFQQVLWLELPLLRSSIVLAMSLAMAYSFGEVATVLMVMDEKTVTLPLWLYRMMCTYRFGEAAFVGVILMAGLVGLSSLWERLGAWRFR